MNRAHTPTAWAFLVVSDPQQADTLADQEAWAREAAHENGWVVTRTISGVSSGKVGARGLTLSMIEDLGRLPPQERPNRILMIRLERLGRGDGSEAMEVFLKVRRLGIVVHTRLDGDVGYGRASELLMPVLRFFIGGMENEVRRDKLLSMYERRRVAQRTDPTRAVSSKMPYGLQLQDGHYAPKPPEDAPVRLAFEMKTQGYGPHLIAKKLAVIAPPMTLKDGSEHAMRWTTDRVRRMLLKSCYRDTIVDGATWERAQRPLRDIHRPTIRHEYSLGGALRCECGYHLVGQRGPRATSVFLYYACSNAPAHQGRYKFYRSDRLVEQFLALLDRLSADDALLRRFLATQVTDTDIDALELRLAAAAKDLSGLDERRRRIFSAFENGALARKDLQWRLDDLREQQTTLEIQVSALQREIATVRASHRSEDDARALVQSARSLWSGAKNDDKRALAKAIACAFGGLSVRTDGSLTVGTIGALPVRSPKRLRHHEG
ncbi:MAG: recombinase family protein [Candidatus Aquilonibacter sp.]|jgi:hypothetical protein